MPTTVYARDVLDIPRWRPLANAPAASAAGVSMCGDPRNNNDRHPELFLLTSATAFHKYNIKNNEWFTLTSPALAGTFGAGTELEFVPDRGPAGTIAAGATSTAIPLTTALPASVAPNQLANRGDSTGFKIRIIGNSAGSSGLTEERYIVGNTGPSTTPTIYLDQALSFAPANGDAYEILSGRVYLLNAGAIGAGTFRYYDVATNSYTTCAQVNLPATISTDSKLLSLSEAKVPYDRVYGEGHVVDNAATPVTYDTTVPAYSKYALQATGSAAGSITGHAADGDAGVFVNEFRNFQIRIVEDTAIPTAVGQRRRIQSHTVGASPVYTITPNWTVTPSVNAKFVIELWTNNIICWTTANTTTYRYDIDGNAWDTATWAVRGSGADGAGLCAWVANGLAYDASATRQYRHSYVYMLRGAATNQIDIFDLAGAATGAWTSDIVYQNKSGATTFTTGTSDVYMSGINQGAYTYLNINGSARFARWCNKCRVLEPWCNLEYAQGTAVVGGNIEGTYMIDGSTKLGFLIFQRRSGAEMFECWIVR